MTDHTIMEIDECYVICPYCGSKYQAEGEDYSEDERDEECFTCGKTYVLYQEFTVNNITRKK